MKKYFATVSIAALLALSGCASKQEYVSHNINDYADQGNESIYKPDKLEDRIKIINELPNWVQGQSNPYMASGSAPYRGQDFAMQRDEAVFVAKQNLAESLEQKVSSLKKLHKSSSNRSNETSFESTGKQVASMLIIGAVTEKTYIANNGELFVLVVVDPEFAKQVAKKQNFSKELKNDKYFIELEDEVKKFEAWKKENQ